MAMPQQGWGISGYALCGCCITCLQGIYNWLLSFHALLACYGCYFNTKQWLIGYAMEMLLKTDVNIIKTSLYQARQDGATY
jgi:hypothetical protein